MGACMSSAGGIEPSPQEKEAHRAAERELKDAKAKMATQVKVRLLSLAVCVRRD